MLNEILHLLREQWVLPIVSSAANHCAPGGPVSTWAVDGMGLTIVPPALNLQSMSRKPGTFFWETSLRAKAGDYLLAKPGWFSGAGGKAKG